LLWSWAEEDFTYHHSGPSPIRPNNLGSAQITEPPGQEPLVVNGVVVDPFEDEEGGIDIASNVVNMKGGDPDTPGSLWGNKARCYVGVPFRGSVLLGRP